jgi:DNA-directed RNA polymerase specialized sigma24 family protein
MMLNMQPEPTVATEMVAWLKDIRTQVDSWIELFDAHQAASAGQPTEALVLEMFPDEEPTAAPSRQRRSHTPDEYKSANKLWTPEEDAMLLRWLKDGLSLEQIAARLDRPPKGVKDRVQRRLVRGME